MKSAKSSGRVIGILLLFQLALGLILPFILVRSLVAGSPSFLTDAAESSFQIRAAVIISFAGAALTVALGVAMLPVLWHYSRSAAFWLLAVCVVSCALDAVHSGTVMSMLSLSQQFVSGSVADPSLYQVVGAAVAASRRSAHVAQLVAIGGWIFVFYVSLLRFALVPRTLAVLGIAGIASQFIGVTLMMLLGRGVIGEMAMPMLPIQIVVGVWLIIKGFNEPVSKTTLDSEFEMDSKRPTPETRVVEV